ncbi:MAG TPA: ABC transporter substrate-binding protein [Acidobacteriota bacterium]|nr:ABC transporter substrate-binding protein [Acidobacteriota bacterium]
MHRITASIIFFALALVNSGADLHAQSAPDKITLGTITLSLNNLPIYVAQDKGFFTKESIFVEAVVLNASTLAIPVLIAGSTQLSASSAMTTIRAVEKGAALKIVGGLTNAPVYDLYAGPKYKSFKDLKGASIGVSGLITSDTVIMKEMLKANGLEYPRDYSMRAMGSMPDRFLAIQTGNIAAGILSPPYTFGADDVGLVNLGATAKYTPNFVQTVFNVRADWAQDKKPLLVRFLRAILRADHWIHTQKEDTVRIILKRFKYNEKHSEASWRYYINNNAIPKDGEINAKGMDKVLQLLQEDGTLAQPLPKPEKYVDMSYLAEARRTLP